jgi:4-hydroxybenzoate polyprenyltransferase
MASRPELARETVPATSSKLLAVLEGLRPGQWVKNGFVFAALIFSRGIADWNRDCVVALAAGIFCLVSSSVYLLNDVFDLAEDRKHPTKRFRPIASGRLSARLAAATSIVLQAAMLVASYLLDQWFFMVVVAYLALNVLYNSYLKRVPLLDVFLVASGFVLRVLGGGVVIHVAISSWLVACTTLLALFLALAKRRHELVLLREEAGEHRPTLAKYSPYFLDQLIGIVTASTVMSYTLYTVSPDVQAKFPGKHLELTVPFVLFGIFRYLYLVHQTEEGGGNPSRLLFTDKVLLYVVALWALTVILIIYW